MIPLMFYGSLSYVALLSFMTPMTLYTYMSCVLYCDTRVVKMSLHGFKTQRQQSDRHKLIGCWGFFPEQCSLVLSRILMLIDVSQSLVGYVKASMVCSAITSLCRTSSKPSRKYRNYTNFLHHPFYVK